MNKKASIDRNCTRLCTRLCSGGPVLPSLLKFWLSNVLKLIVFLAGGLSNCDGRQCTVVDSLVRGEWLLRNTSSMHASEPSFDCCELQEQETDEAGNINSSGSKVCSTAMKNVVNRGQIPHLEEERDERKKLRCVPCRADGYYWQPNECDLHIWDGNAFCQALNGRRILFVGDSLTFQLTRTLLQMLEGQECQPNIFYGRATHLSFDEGKKYNLAGWLESIPADIVILNTGAWLRDDGDMWTVLDALGSITKNHLNRTPKPPNPIKFIWTTFSEGHVGCWRYPEPIKEDFTFPTYNVHKYNWELIPKYNELALNYSKLMNFTTIDLAPMLRLRPDAKVGTRDDHWGFHEVAGGGVDCLHFCLPGPLNVFPPILLNMLASES